MLTYSVNRHRDSLFINHIQIPCQSLRDTRMNKTCFLLFGGGLGGQRLRRKYAPKMAIQYTSCYTLVCSAFLGTDIGKKCVILYMKSTQHTSSLPSESIGFQSTEHFGQNMDASFLSHSIKLQHRYCKLTGFLLGPTNTPLLYNCLNNIILI